MLYLLLVFPVLLMVLFLMIHFRRPPAPVVPQSVITLQPPPVQRKAQATIVLILIFASLVFILCFYFSRAYAGHGSQPLPAAEPIPPVRPTATEPTEAPTIIPTSRPGPNPVVSTTAPGPGQTIRGPWTFEVEGKLNIVWSIVFSLKDDRLGGTGNKLFVKGKAATVGERNTVLTMEGKPAGPNTYEGNYQETNAAGTMTAGDFCFVFGPDGRSFTGTLTNPKTGMASKVTGTKK